ncbi:MAG: uracil-DNA glycosylase [Thermoleophilia bacterium]|nr:uracil-DNA glycosylase [Thermoleophilia bacterium]
MNDEAGARKGLRALAAELADCRACGLCAGRTQVVFGVGSPVADLMFVGEGPGYHEDTQGEPFVGQAGKLLTELLQSIGLARGDVYIANVVKCRPPGNRDPLPEEIAACTPHLMEQVRIIRPRVVCTLGRFATRLIAQTEAGMTSVRGRVKQTEVAGVPVLVFPVFHPAAALYTPANRSVLEEDFLKLKRVLERGTDALARVAADPPLSGEVQLSGEAPLPSEAPLRADGPAGSGPAEQLPLW